MFSIAINSTRIKVSI